MNNKDRVLKFLASNSPRRFTNADIRASTRVSPHQQVYQITRELVKTGRIRGQQFGHEWRFWIDSPESDEVKKKAEDSPTSARQRPVDSLELSKKTLLIIPCSGAKRTGGERCTEVSIMETLDPDHITALSEGRVALREVAHINEQALMPAYRRYSGYLYGQCEATLDSAVSNGQPIQILSGGYGLLLANEPIGTYEKVFKVSDWPKGLLESCILDYVRYAKIKSVIAVMSGTTDYARLVRRVNWRQAGVIATLVSPVSTGGGAMVKVPRAQGQAIDQLIKAGLDDSWRSSDSLGLRIESL